MILFLRGTLTAERAILSSSQKISLLQLGFWHLPNVFYILFSVSKNCFKRLISHYFKIFFLHSNLFPIFKCHLPISASRGLSCLVSIEIQIALLERKTHPPQSPKTKRAILKESIFNIILFCLFQGGFENISSQWYLAKALSHSCYLSICTFFYPKANDWTWRNRKNLPIKAQLKASYPCTPKLI